MTDDKQTKGLTSDTVAAAKAFTRRSLLKGSVAVGGAAAVFGAASQVGAPYIGTAKAKTTTWKIQTSWWNGVQGWPYFEKWCKTIIEKTGGELELKPFDGGADVGHVEV